MATYGTFANGVSLKAAEVNDFFVWTSFTPLARQSVTFSYSAGIGRYAKVNKLVHAVCYFRVTSAGTPGNALECDLPVTAATTSMRTVGWGIIGDDSTSTFYNVYPVLSSTTRVRFLTSSATSLTSYFGLTNGPAITFASNDSAEFHIVYEAA